MWFWDRADALLFFRGRLHFYHADGTRGRQQCRPPAFPAPYATRTDARLEASGIDGKFIRLGPKGGFAWEQ